MSTKDIVENAVKPYKEKKSTSVVTRFEGGDLVGPDHPIFNNWNNYSKCVIPNTQPAGARFDPYGPEIGPMGHLHSGPRKDYFGPNPDELYPPGFGANRNF